MAPISFWEIAFEEESFRAPGERISNAFNAKLTRASPE
jgi:hypothetical protein